LQGQFDFHSVSPTSSVTRLSVRNACLRMGERFGAHPSR
jgi:hypothetical protein